MRIYIYIYILIGFYNYLIFSLQTLFINIYINYEILNFDFEILTKTYCFLEKKKFNSHIEKLKSLD